MIYRSRRNKRKSLKRKHTKKHLVKRRSQNKRNRKQYSRKMRNRKQYGGNFNNQQIQQIREAIERNQSTEPFTDEQIEEYIQKINDISQAQLSGKINSFDDFYWHMVEHLEGLHDETFKQWVDRVYEEQLERVETDIEENDDDDF